mgnify:CR=1 FL=1
MDDNARALIVAIRAHALTADNGLLDYVRHYLAFVERCQRPDGRFRNFMAADGSWLEEVGSDDSQGRAIWALGFAAGRSAQTEVRLRALRCLDGALPRLRGLEFLRSRAFVLLGVQAWAQVEPAAELDELAGDFGADLAAAYERCAGPGWRWFEDVATYCNTRLSQALLGTGWSNVGLESLAWLCTEMDAGTHMNVVGNHGWYPRGGRPALFDQQPVDAGATVAACVAAYQLSGEERFRRWAELSCAWFQGRNITGRPMIDHESGGCYDGLEETGVNSNQGAESLLAWLMAQEDLLEMGWTEAD